MAATDGGGCHIDAQGIGPAAAIDRVTHRVVAATDDDQVVAVSGQNRVSASVAVDGVVANAGAQVVIAQATGEILVADVAQQRVRAIGSIEGFANDIRHIDGDGLGVGQAAVAGSHGNRVGTLGFKVSAPDQGNGAADGVDLEVRGVGPAKAVVNNITGIAVRAGDGVNNGIGHVLRDAAHAARGDVRPVVGTGYADCQRLRDRCTLVICHREAEGVVDIGFQAFDGRVIGCVKIGARSGVDGQGAVTGRLRGHTIGNRPARDAKDPGCIVVGIGRGQRAALRRETVVRRRVDISADRDRRQGRGVVGAVDGDDEVVRRAVCRKNGNRVVSVFACRQGIHGGIKRVGPGAQ